MCGCTGNRSLAARPVRWTIRPSRGNGRLRLSHKHVRARPLQWPQSPKLRAAQRMDALDPALGPVHMQSPVPEIDLRPAKLAELSCTQPMHAHLTRKIRVSDYCGEHISNSPVLPARANPIHGKKRGVSNDTSGGISAFGRSSSRSSKQDRRPKSRRPMGAPSGRLCASS